MASAFLIQIATKPLYKRNFLPEVNELSTEQITILRIPINKDILVSGPAGSGKTILAIHRTKAYDNNPGALITYTNLLLSYIHAQIDASLSQLEIDSIFSYVKKISGITVPPFADSVDFINSAKRAADWAKSNTDKLYFIIADESQDLCEGHLDFISYYAKHLTLFADEAQSLYKQGLSTNSIIGKLSLQHNRKIIRKEVRGNYRNQPVVSQFAQPFYQFRSSEPLSAARQSGREEPVEVFVFNDRQNLISPVIEKIKNYLASINDASPKIGILTQDDRTMRRLAASFKEKGINTYKSTNGQPIVALPSGENNIYTSPHPVIMTMFSAKGIEFDYVILFDLDFNRLKDNHPRNYEKIIFTAITRARRSVSVFIKSDQNSFFDKIKNVKFNLRNI